MSAQSTNGPTVKCLTVVVLGAALLAGCDRVADHSPTAPPPMHEEVVDQAGPISPGPTEDVITVPTPLNVDVLQLLPVPVELATPTLCGDITVYDEEDLATLCSPTTLAATTITSPTCPQLVSGSVRLETDMLCLNTSGLIVAADNTVIDLNGHTIKCQGNGYFGSCQGPAVANGQIGVDTRAHSNVHVFSHVPGGTIDGFDVGIIIRPQSHDIKVKQLTITGPAGAPGARRPSFTIGIRIDGVDCNGGTVKIGGGTKTGNDISNHNRGIQLFNSSCVYIGYNRVHDNRKNFNPPTLGDHAVGIAVFDSPNNHIRSNVVTDNGDGFQVEGGLALIDPPTTSVLVVENEVNNNRGNGIETIQGALANDIVNNQMLNNTNIDAFSDQSGVNTWNENNRCVTQTTPQPPPGVCGPSEAPPPQ